MYENLIIFSGAFEFKNGNTKYALQATVLLIIKLDMSRRINPHMYMV